MDIPACSHLMSNHDGTLIVGDGCGTLDETTDLTSSATRTDPYLHVFDVRSKSARRVARHDTSWRVYKGNRQVTHPHPSFTPDLKRVLYSSDCDGEPAMFLADVPAS